MASIIANGNGVAVGSLYASTIGNSSEYNNYHQQMQQQASVTNAPICYLAPKKEPEINKLLLLEEEND